MLFFWILIFTFNLFFAIMLAGTWQSAVSLFFVAASLYYIIKHLRRRSS